MGLTLPLLERRAIRVLAAVQLVVIVDFTMILPLGPDLAAPLGLAPSALALLSAVYTVGAAGAGLVATAIFDRLGGRDAATRVRHQRAALLIALGGLAGADLLGGAATGLWSLLGSRLLAGLFGGPAVGIGQALLADVVPEARRGRAMGVVLGANALAAVVGVPIGLSLAQLAGWRAPFWALSGAAALVAWLVFRHFDPAPIPTIDGPRSALTTMLRRPLVGQAYGLVVLTVAAAFLLTPNLSAFAQHNLGLPRAHLPGLYALGGLLGVVSLRQVGQLVDRHGARGVGAASLIVFVLIILAFLVMPQPMLPVSMGFVLLLVSLASRNVAVRTLTSRVPHPHERGRFMALQTTAQHVASAAGALGSAALLGTAADGTLIGMPTVGLCAVALSIAALPLLYTLENQLGPMERHEPSG